MIHSLRNYQQDLYLRARESLMRDRSVCLQLATGAGKTPITSAICESVFSKKRRAWVVVNRNELITQTSKHLKKWGVHHSLISSSMQESKAFLVHIVSKDTLIRRYDKIKNWPDLLMFDECHLFLDRQLEIISHLPEKSKIIGLTATPERYDQRGLSTQAGGVYELLIEGPSIPQLTADGFLSPLKYFSPPIDGLQNIHTKGYDYDEEELEELLQRRKVYGEVVGHYEKYGKGKPALIFCRSVKSAYQTAERFRDKGFNFHTIEGKMSDKSRREMIAALTDGTIDGLTNCELATYGIDIPRVEYGASIRPTLSRALYFQMIGRILRPYSDPVSGYKKESALFFDHVNLVLEHQDENYPGMPPHYAPHIEWNFHGTEKKKKDKTVKNMIMCPHLDFMYCEHPHCTTCSHNPDHDIKDARQPMVVIPADLQELTKPVLLSDRPYEERKDIQDKIGSAVLEYSTAEKTGKILPGPVGELLRIAESLGYNIMWTYWKLNSEERKTINIPLLHEIARQKNFKKGWVFFKIQELKKHRKGA